MVNSYLEFSGLVVNDVPSHVIVYLHNNNYNFYYYYIMLRFLFYEIIH